VPNDPDPMRTNERALDLLTPITDELYDRLDLKTMLALGDKGGDAITTALTKAFILGDHFARTEVAATLIESGAKGIQVNPPDPDLQAADIWDDKHDH
jgi:hypothetical protein